MDNRYKYDVFLSFSSKDLDFVKPIWKKMTDSGLKVFFSDEDLKRIIGFEFDDEIEQALEKSQHFVMVCTPNAKKSKWVKRESKAFFNQIFDEENEKERRFIILEGNGFTPSLLPLMMRTLHTAKSDDEIIKILVDKVVTQKSGQKESTFQKPDEPLEKKKYLFDKHKSIPQVDYAEHTIDNELLKRRKKIDKYCRIAVYLFMLVILALSTFAWIVSQGIIKGVGIAMVILSGIGSLLSLANLLFSFNVSEWFNKNVDSFLFKNFKNLAYKLFLKEQKKNIQLRNKIIKWFGIAVVLTVLITSIFLGIKLIKNSKTPSQKTSPPLVMSPQKQHGQKIYVTNLSFMDALTITPIVNREVSKILNEAIIKGMNEAEKSNNSLVINGIVTVGIPNNDENVNRLVNITIDPNMTKSEKIEKIIIELMNPHNLDVIVTGHYIDDAKNPLVSVCPLLIVKNNKKITTKKIQFTREELICENKNTKRKNLCLDSFSQISQSVKELLEELKYTDLKVSNLSFIDALAWCSMANTELSELFNEAVINGMKEAKMYNVCLAINGTKGIIAHAIPNNDENAWKLVNITFDPNITTHEKINKIISDLMIPYNVDVIVTGHYIDDAKNPLISVRPLMIVKANQKIVTKNLQFTKEELFCQDPISNKEILCAGAHDQIAQEVQELLEQL